MTIDIDQVFDHIGAFGRYQRIIYVLTCITSIFCGQPVVLLTFVAYMPEYRCHIKGCDNEDSPKYSEPFLNFTTPENDDSDSDSLWKNCQMFNRVNGTFNELVPNLWANKMLNQDMTCDAANFDQFNEVDCSDWVYDYGEFGINSVVNKFDLTCSNEWLVPLGGSAYMIGMMFGGVTIGAIADKFGRRPGYLITIIVTAIGGLICAGAVNIIMFLIGRFIAGLGCVGLYQMAFILAVEFVGMKYRTLCGILINITFALGEASVGLMAYFITDWYWLLVAVAAPSMIQVLFVLYIPESPRWLNSKGLHTKTVNVLEKIARANGRDVPTHLLTENPADATAEDTTQEIDANSNKDLKSVKTKTVLDLFMKPNMRKRTFNMFYIWMVCTMAYYGLSSNSGNLGGNIYINFVATMLIEIPSYIFTYFVLDRMGRKGTLSFVLLLGGVASFCCAFIPEGLNWLIVTLSLVGKFGISAAFSIIYVYSAELFPTDYRSVALGACSTCARIGGILAPFIASSGSLYTPLPLLTFGGTAIISGILVLLLPETAGAQLPETLEQSEAFGTDQGILYFTCFGKKTMEDDDKEDS